MSNNTLHQTGILFGGRAMLALSTLLIDFFGVVYFFQAFHQNIFLAVLPFLITYALYAFGVFAVARRFYVKGRDKRRLFLFGVILLILSYLVLGIVGVSVASIIIFGLLQAGFRSFFWLPYQVNVAKAMPDGHRGQISGRWSSLRIITTTLAPVISAVIIEEFGFSALYLAAAITAGFAVLLFYQAENSSKGSFVLPTQKIFSTFRKNLDLLWAHFSLGMEHGAHLLFWPLALWFVTDGEIVTMGIITTLAMVIALLLGLAVGELLDRERYAQRITPIILSLQSVAWLGRFIASTSGQAFVADAFFRPVTQMKDSVFEKHVYDHTDNSVDLADEYIVLKTISLNIGRVTMFLLGVGIFLITGKFQLVFLVAAIATLGLYHIVKERPLRSI